MFTSLLFHPVHLRFLRAALLTAVVVVAAFSMNTPVHAQNAQTQLSQVTEETTTDDQQDGDDQTEEPETPPTLTAKAGPERNVVAGRTVLFDASGSTQGPASETQALFYRWDFGDGKTASGFDATHEYAESGRYTVTLTVTRILNGVTEEAKDSTEVNVQDRLVLMIVDQSIAPEALQQAQSYGLTQGALIVPIQAQGVDQEYVAVQQIAQELIKHSDDVRAAEMIISWTSGNVGLNALVEMARILTLNQASITQFGFDAKAIVAIASNQSITATSRFAQSVFQSVTPQYIVVGGRSLVNTALHAQSPEELQEALRYTENEYQIITPYTARGLEQLSPLNFMSYALNYMVNNGVPVNSLYLVLMLPVLATIIAATRQIIGIKAFGIYVPTITALSFLAMGLKYGITVFLTLVILGSVARIIARKLKIMYMPRMAIVLSLLAAFIFIMFFVGAFMDKTGFIAISIFPILILTVITEHFVTVQIEQGIKSAVKLTIETLVLALIGFFIADWSWFKSIILAFPELILFTFLINYGLGKFTGLRVTEYIRFRHVFKHMRNAEPSK